MVEWPATKRGALEARMRDHPVAVRFAGCELTVLAQCKVPGSYRYRSLTPKRDRVIIRDVDELYANLPLGAASLEGKLESAGSLDVSMTVVGRFDLDRESVRADELTGDCAGATHVLAATSVGSFAFYAGDAQQVGGGVVVAGAGGGGLVSKSRELLVQDGDDAACQASSGTDAAPPFGCGAPIRLELTALGAAPGATPTCPPGLAWDGRQCATTTASSSTATSGATNVQPSTQPTCPSGMVFIPGGAPFIGPDGSKLVVAKGYCLDRTEVTASAYAGCVKSGQCTASAIHCGVAATFDADALGQHPINCATREEALHYCAFAGKRLPTKSEFWWAYRSGERAWPFPWGTEAPTASRGCTSIGGARLGTCPVGSAPSGANAFGVLDLFGNVGEWVEVTYQTHTTIAAHWASTADPSSWSSGDGERVGFRCALTP